jgi:Mn-dependent DtxR family transcriptional regulator
MGVPEREVEHDVEGMEHHLSAASLTAIEVLFKELSQNGTFLSKVRDAVGRMTAN